MAKGLGGPLDRLGPAPFVQHVGLTLLVPRTIALGDEGKAVTLIEAAGAQIPGEGVEAEPVPRRVARGREQPCADALLLTAGQDVELLHYVAAERRETD